MNDTLGHLVGDRLLVELGRRLAAFGVDGRTVGRLGGDEFLMVLPGADLDSAEQVATAVMAAVAEPLRLGGQSAPMSTRASVGIAATRGRRGLDASDLYREADIALYAAKESGRGRTAAYDEGLEARTGERASVEVALRAALRARRGAADVPADHRAGGRPGAGPDRRLRGAGPARP